MRNPHTFDSVFYKLKSALKIKIFLKINRTLHLKRVNFTLFELYFNKIHEWGKSIALTILIL